MKSLGFVPVICFLSASIARAEISPGVSYNTTASTLHCNGVAGCTQNTPASVTINGIRITYNPVSFSTATTPSIVNLGNLLVAGSGADVNVTGLTLSININSTPPGSSGTLPPGLISGALGTDNSKAAILFGPNNTTTGFGTLPGVIIGRDWSSYIYQVLNPSLGLQAPTIGNPAGMTSIQGTVTNNSSGAQVSFVKYDAATRGSWKGVYGQDGQIIAGDAFNPPAYAVVSLSMPSWTWVYNTVDPRAMQKVTSASRIASTLYGNPNFTFGLNLTDGALHRVAMYLLDWDYGSRNEKITIRETGTGQLLDQRSVSAFEPGTWVVWNIKGNVQVEFTRTVGANAILGGIFFE